MHVSRDKILERPGTRVHALVNVLIEGNREWGMMARLPQSHSEWCILRHVDKSVLSQTESRVLRLIQNVRGHLQNNVAFNQSQDTFNEILLVYGTGYTY